MQAQLLAAAKPYLLLFACLALAPPLAALSAPFCLLYAAYALLILTVACWVAYINSLLLDDLVVNYALDGLTSVLGIAEHVSVALIYAIIQGNMSLNYRRLQRIFAAVRELERDIDASALSAVARPRIGLRWRLALHAGAYTLLLAFGLSYVDMQLISDPMSLPNKVASTFVLISVQLKLVEYNVFVLLLQTLLQRLLAVLQQLRRELRACQLPALQQALCLRLRFNQLLLARIWRLAGPMERYFKWPLMSLFLYNGIAIVHIINWAYIMSFSPTDCCRYLRFVKIGITLVSMLIPCWLSQCCIDTYNEFARILHQVRSTGADTMLRQRVREYSLQLLHQRLLFTCGGFFDINLKYFGSLVLTITTYAVLLLQFKLQAEAERKQLQSVQYTKE